MKKTAIKKSVGLAMRFSWQMTKPAQPRLCRFFTQKRASSEKDARSVSLGWFAQPSSFSWFSRALLASIRASTSSNWL